MDDAAVTEKTELGLRLNLPFLQGAYLAFNAIPDAYFLGDGPDCLFAKAEQIHGRHDLFSTLLSCASDHRVHYTGSTVFNMASNPEPVIAAALRRVAATPGCGAVFLGSMPMCTLAGTDYERVLREAFPPGSLPAYLIPRRSAAWGDWLDGYAAVLEALAAGIPLEGAAPRPEAAAVVGYLMDRNEGDHRGNVRELGRILEALGLEPASIWLSGRPYGELGAVRRAGTIISLPHGRKAARTLARRLGARLVEAELPFGLEGTRRFVETLGRELGREERARGFIRRELDQVVPRLEWTVPHAFQGRRFAFAGDPHYAAAFARLIEEVGGESAGLIVLGARRHLAPAEREFALSRGAVFEPPQHEASGLWARAAAGGLDLAVGCTLALRYIERVGQAREAPWAEFGFPSEYTHVLADQPFLGFAGALNFLSDLANAVCRGLRGGERGG